jgi:hypothetical protein
LNPDGFRSIGANTFAAVFLAVLNPTGFGNLPSPWMVVMGVQFGIELLLLIDHFGFRVFRFSMCTFRLTCCGSAQDVGFTREPERVRILS